MNVEDLIKELEKHKGKQVFVSTGMFFRNIKGITEEEPESNMIYIDIKK